MAIMEINNLPLVSSINDTDLLVIETANGTKAVTKSTLSPSTMIFSNVAPTNTNTCWVDISKGNMIKAYNPITLTWENISNLSSPVIYYMADGVAIVKGLIYKYKDTSDIVIPSEIDGVSVAGIGVNSFSQYTNLTHITIPLTVSSINSNAFNGCTALTTVYFEGTEEQWNAISIDTGNDALLNATKVFDYGTKGKDWNENNPNSEKYIESRTHYISDPVETVLLEETSITTEGESQPSAFVSDSVKLVEGYTYLVTFNGTEYECVAYYCDDWEFVIIGNGSLIDAEGGNGEPFACISMEGDGSDLITQEAGTYTLKIVEVISEVIKLPTEYLINFNVRNGEGSGSVVEGKKSLASGRYSHAEGYLTTASGITSHAEGQGTIANGHEQHVQGRYNLQDTEKKYAHIVGNGTKSARSNAHTIDWEGNAWFSGDVYINSTSGTDKDEGSKKLATEEYVDIRVPAWTDADEGKILQIVNGTPTWVSLPIAEEASF